MNLHVDRKNGEQPAKAADHLLNKIDSTPPKAPLIPPEYRTIPEAARELRRTPRTIQSWLAQGRLPCVRIGRSVLLHWPTVQKHLADNFTIGGRR